MDDLREKRNIENKKKKLKLSNIKRYITINKSKIITVVLVVSLVFFPQEIGTYIGQFITDFLGNIIKNIHL